MYVWKPNKINILKGCWQWTSVPIQGIRGGGGGSSTFKPHDYKETGTSSVRISHLGLLINFDLLNNQLENITLISVYSCHDCSSFLDVLKMSHEMESLKGEFNVS